MALVWSRLILIAGLALVLLPAPVLGRATPCAGDCSGDGTVSIAELIQAVTVALGDAPVARCAAADAAPDGAVTVDELVRAVGHALTGCPPDMPGPPLVVIDVHVIFAHLFDEARNQYEIVAAQF